MYLKDCCLDQTDKAWEVIDANQWLIGIFWIIDQNDVGAKPFPRMLLKAGVAAKSLFLR